MKMLKCIKNKIYAVYNTAKQCSSSKCDFFLIAFDYIYCKFRFHITSNEYITYKFFNLKNRYRKNFILTYDRLNNYKKINSKGITSSKYAFYNELQDLYRRDVILIPDCGEDVLLEFAKKHKKFIVKPDKGSLGNGVSVFEYTDEKSLLELYEQSFANRRVCEEYICQHPVMASICPYSVNSIRVVSIIDDGNVEIICAALRSGASSDSIVDNMNQGGVGALIDIDSGIVSTFGFDKKRNKYPYHPTTGTKLIGLELPNWQKLIDRVKEAHKRVPQWAIFGWDMVLTKDDIDIIEANDRPGAWLMQNIDLMPKGEKIFKLVKKGNPNRIVYNKQKND